jgi:hypothetical protein
MIVSAPPTAEIPGERRSGANSMDTVFAYWEERLAMNSDRASTLSQLVERQGFVFNRIYRASSLFRAAGFRRIGRGDRRRESAFRLAPTLSDDGGATAF